MAARPADQTEGREFAEALTDAFEGATYGEAHLTDEYMTHDAMVNVTLTDEEGNRTEYVVSVMVKV